MSPTAPVGGGAEPPPPAGRPPRPSWPRPVRAAGTVAGSLVAMAAWAAVAHSSGSGWVQAVGILVGSTLVVGVVAPVVPLLRTQVAVVDAPVDGRAGRVVDVEVRVSGPARLTAVAPPGPATLAGGPVRGARTVVLSCTPARRGVIGAVVVDVASSAPFGLVWWTRRVALPLPRPLAVAPRWGGTGAVAAVAGTRSEGTVRPERAVGGDPAGVRPYAPGDPRRAVHWPATAHTGTLMVREAEDPRRAPLLVDLVLPDDPQAAERTAEDCMASIPPLLDRGSAVVLATDEAAPPGGGPPVGVRRVVRPVLDPLDVGRRLARAVARPPEGRRP